MNRCWVFGIMLVLSGCGAGADDGNPSSLDFHACDEGIECATLEVPNVYGAADGLTQQLAVARVRATDPGSRIGVLLYNLGGPGESAVEHLGGFHGFLTSWAPELTARFDLVAFDPRGIGRSTPKLSYLSDELLDAFRALDPTPGDDAARAEHDAVGDDVLASASRLDGRFAAHVDTESVARDMDRLRDALGEAYLNYWGGSYGGLLGGLHATLFPEHVRAFVLDSPVTPEVNRLEILHGQAEAYETAYAAFRDFCEATERCALHELGSAGLEQAVDALVEGKDHAPIDVEGRRLTGSDILVALAGSLAHGRNVWPSLAERLEGLLAGDGATTLTSADFYWGRKNEEGDADDIADAYTAISALDAPFPAGFDRAEFDVYLETEVLPVGPHFGPVLAEQERISVGWPFDKGRALPHVDARSAPPLLVLGGIDDPVTPIRWAYAMRDALGNGSTLVTHDDQVHGQFLTSECVREHVVAFLVDPGAPRADETCPFEPAE